MSKQEIERFDVGARMSEMAVHNGVAYLAGQVAADGSQDITGQTQQVLAAIDALLVRAGTDKRKLLLRPALRPLAAAAASLSRRRIRQGRPAGRRSRRRDRPC